MASAVLVRLAKGDYLGRKSNGRCKKPPEAPEIVSAELFRVMFLSPLVNCVYFSLWLSHSGKTPRGKSTKPLTSAGMQVLQ